MFGEVWAMPPRKRRSWRRTPANYRPTRLCNSFLAVEQSPGWIVKRPKCCGPGQRKRLQRNSRICWLAIRRWSMPGRAPSTRRWRRNLTMLCQGANLFRMRCIKARCERARISSQKLLQCSVRTQHRPIMLSGKCWARHRTTSGLEIKNWWALLSESWAGRYWRWSWMRFVAVPLISSRICWRRKLLTTKMTRMSWPSAALHRKWRGIWSPPLLAHLCTAIPLRMW